jgi:hypothetical protein
MLGDYTTLIYLGLNAFLLVSLVGALMRSDALRDQTLGLSLIYTVGVTFLSYTFFVGPTGDSQGPEYWRLWQIWLGATFVLSWLYFKSLVWFEESRLFWIVVAAGTGLLWSDRFLLFLAAVWRQLS